MSEHHQDHDEVKSEKKQDSGAKYWLSLEQWSNDPEFQKVAEQEFMSSPLKEGDKEDGWARREFLKLMGASLALSSAGCLRRPVQKIVPYAKQPEEVTLGVPNFYTSSWFDGTEVFGALVKTREGRPIKMEGNPNYPTNSGALSARAQAHILSLYDPERIQAPARHLVREGRTNFESVSTSWADLDKKVIEKIKSGGVYLLTGEVTSPSMRQLIADFSQGTGAKHVVWQPLSNEDISLGQKASYGTEVVPAYRFDKAKIILSVGADFLGTWMTPVTFSRQFAKGRRDIEGMNRLYSADAHFSLTGANADIRFKVKPSQQLDFVMGLLHDIIVAKGASKYAADSQLKSSLSKFAGMAAKLQLNEEAWGHLVADLVANKGKGLVVAGGPTAATANGLKLQVAVNLLNSALENDGSTVNYSIGQSVSKTSTSDMVALMSALKAKKVKTLIIHGVNPGYSMGGAFTEALANADFVVYTGDRVDETGKSADYLAPDNHALENWGDAEAVGGIYAISQPTIRPMYDTRSFQLSLLTWVKAFGGPARVKSAETAYDYVQTYWKENIFPKYGKGTFDDFWYEVLQKGVFDASGGKYDANASSRSASAKELHDVNPSTQQGYELVLHSTVQLGAGEMANVSWLQELPDSITKIVWDNYASISLATAEKLGAKEGHLLDVEVNGKKMTIPAHIQPGQHDDVIAIAIGYGRTHAGKVGNGVGINVYPWVKHGDLAIYSGATVTVANTKKAYPIANVQGHHSMEGRAIANEATLKDFLKNKGDIIHRHKIFSIWPYHKYDGHKWGMSVDLNSCTGCSACTVACQSENNIPVVGKTYVIQGREMSWIRIDRYYAGNPADAEAIFQPVMCQHCDNAPCETVCPVIATSHSDEGLNEMIYNRCVGTRYCSNNCPYKVRRFNWFNYRKEMKHPENMAFNPEVTVRMRGVMEKCTFCVQRIKAGKNAAAAENRKLKDGDIKVACEQSCPTNAIVFGDINDPESRVHKIFKEEARGYALLEEFNAAPAVRYLAKIRNNHKESSGEHT